MINKTRIVIGLLLIACLLTFCGDDEEYNIPFNNNMKFPEKLSDLHLFEDIPNLKPANDVHIYELASTLFTDHAEKQRLIKLPPNTKMTKIDSELPDFPDGTILAKTFYYFHNATQPNDGKNIIETRVLLKNDNVWNIGTYLWNETQTDAYYIEDGQETKVDWIDDQGYSQRIVYNVPTANDCAICHQTNKVIIPIGPKLKNMNRDIMIDDVRKNQLIHFQDIKLLNNFDLKEVNKVPAYTDHSLPIAERGRAYLDINCAHCHTKGGMAEDQWINLNYETPISETGILWSKSYFLYQVASGEMPYIGTSEVDQKGLQILREFMESL